MTDTTFDAFTPAAVPPPGAVPIPPPASGGVIADDQVSVPEHPAPFVIPAPAAVALAAGRPLSAPEGAHLMPSGNWVQISDAHQLTRGDKRELVRKSWEQQTFAERVWVSTDLLLARLIVGWSYPLPLPSEDPTSLNRVPVEDDDAISELIAEANDLLFPNPVTPDDHADPTSPTAPSGE